MTLGEFVKDILKRGSDDLRPEGEDGVPASDFHKVAYLLAYSLALINNGGEILPKKGECKCTRCVETARLTATLTVFLSGWMEACNLVDTTENKQFLAIVVTQALSGQLRFVIDNFPDIESRLLQIITEEITDKPEVLQ